jgi:hypothetical protein
MCIIVSALMGIYARSCVYSGLIGLSVVRINYWCVVEKIKSGFKIKRPAKAGWFECFL